MSHLVLFSIRRLLPGIAKRPIVPMPAKSKIVSKHVVGADTEKARRNGPEWEPGLCLDPMIQFLPSLADSCIGRGFCEFVAHHGEAWLPLLNEGLFVFGHLAVEHEALTCPLRTL